MAKKKFAAQEKVCYNTKLKIGFLLKGLMKREIFEKMQTMIDITTQLSIIKRGIVDLISEEELGDKGDRFIL